MKHMQKEKGNVAAVTSSAALEDLKSAALSASELHEENAELKAQVLALKAENSNLLRRLEKFMEHGKRKTRARDSSRD